MKQELINMNQVKQGDTVIAGGEQQTYAIEHKGIHYCYDGDGSDRLVIWARLELPIKKWEPKHGYWRIDREGDEVSDADNHTWTNDFGMLFRTEEEAEKASKIYRTYQYTLEFDEDLEDVTWFIYYDTQREMYRIGQYTYGTVLGIIYMSHGCAVDLAKKLNSGEVEL